jgi:hypothetical protein
MSNFGFSVSSGVIYVPDLGGNYPSGSASSSSSTFSPSGGGSFSGCYIYLVNNSNSPTIATLPSNPFTIDIV